MADYSYLPLGWTCQNLLNNATQNLGYDMLAPTFPGHPSVLPAERPATHPRMMMGGPTDSPAGPVSLAQMENFLTPGIDTDVPSAVNPRPEIPEGTSKKAAAAMLAPESTGSNVSTPLSRDSRTPDPVPVPSPRASAQGEEEFATANERSAAGLSTPKNDSGPKLDTEVTPPKNDTISPALKPDKDQSAPQKNADSKETKNA